MEPISKEDERNCPPIRKRSKRIAAKLMAAHVFAINEQSQTSTSQLHLNKFDFLKTLNLGPSTIADAYEHIEINEIIHKAPEDYQITTCVCSPKRPCGHQCINHITRIECDPETCPAKQYCDNQFFQRGSLYKLKVKVTGSKGYGVFALQQIPAESFLIEYVGQVINKNEFDKRFKESRTTQKFYYMALDEGFIIDAQYKGNESRYINHSCQPNSEVRKWTVNKQQRLGLFSIKPILEVSVFFVEVFQHLLVYFIF